MTPSPASISPGDAPAKGRQTPAGIMPFSRRPSTNGEHASQMRRELIGWMQLFTLIVGVSTVVFALGRKDERLDRLTQNVQMLTTAVYDLTTARAVEEQRYKTQKAALDEIKRDLKALYTQGTPK